MSDKVGNDVLITVAGSDGTQADVINIHGHNCLLIAKSIIAATTTPYRITGTLTTTSTTANQVIPLSVEGGTPSSSITVPDNYKLVVPVLVTSCELTNITGVSKPGGVLYLSYSGSVSPVGSHVAASDRVDRNVLDFADMIVIPSGVVIQATVTPKTTTSLSWWVLSAASFLIPV